MRRRFKRISLKGDSVRAETVTETKAQIADLSMGGIGIKSPKRLVPGSNCMVTIGNNGSLMVLRGTTVWERFSGWSMGQRGHADPLFSAGIHLDESRSDLMAKACGGDCDKTRTLRVQAPNMNILLSFAETLTVLNISFGGLLAESWNPMDVGTESDTRIFLPDRPEPLKCLVRVTSCKTVKHETEKKYHIGFEFVNLDAEQAERIKTFIRIRSAI